MVDKRGLNSKKYFLIVSSLIIFSILASFASAAITVTRPASNTNYSDTVFFNVTYVNGTDFSDARNATFFYNISGTWTKIPVNVSCTAAPTAAGTGFCTGNLTINVSNGIFDGRYAITANLSNTTTYNGSATVITQNVTFDSIAPSVSTFYITTNGAFFNGTITINVSVSDAGLGVGTVYFNITNGSVKGQVNYTQASNVTGGYYNLTVDTTGFPDGKYNITVYANDSLHLNSTERIQITIDDTVPTASYACSPTSVTIGKVTVCTCVGTDVTADVNYTSDGDTSTTAATLVASVTTRSAGSFTRTCTVKDKAGNIGTDTASYTVTASSGGGTGGGTTSTPKDTTTTSTTISPSTPATLSSFDSASGVQQIQVTVTQTVTNAQVSVTKYTSKPSAVSVEQGNTYKYFQVQAPSLTSTSLSKAVMEIKVEKSWISSKGINKEDVALFKYDGAANKWNQLTTTFKSEDATYYYYTAEVNSFSYFAIASKTTTGTGEEQPTGTGEEQPSGTIATTLLGLPYWVWIIIVIAVLAVLVAVLTLKRKKK